MATVVHVLEGDLHWAKVTESRRDMEGYQGAYKECDGAYTVDLHVSSDEKQEFEKLGTSKRFNYVPETDKWRIRLVRKHDDRRPEWGGPPQISLPDGHDPEDTLIANGSKGRIAVSVYDTKMGKGTRMERIEVTDLQVYEPPEDSRDNIPF